MTSARHCPSPARRRAAAAPRCRSREVRQQAEILVDHADPPPQPPAARRAGARDSRAQHRHLGRLGRTANCISRSRLDLPAPEAPSSQWNAAIRQHQAEIMQHLGTRLGVSALAGAAIPETHSIESDHGHHSCHSEPTRRHCFAITRYPTISPGMRIVCPSCSAAYDVPDCSVDRWAHRAMRALRCGMDAGAAGCRAARGGSAAATVHGRAPAPAGPSPRSAARANTAPVRDGSSRPRIPVRLQPRSTLLRLAWAASLVLLVLAFGAAFAWRYGIVSAWPPSAHAYAALGMHPQAPVPR